MNKVNNKVIYFIVIYDVYLKRFHSLMTESVNDIDLSPNIALLIPGNPQKPS